jgi:hypothetical protein
VRSATSAARAPLAAGAPDASGQPQVTALGYAPFAQHAALAEVAAGARTVSLGDQGVVVGVEMSGRLSRRAARGRDIFVDPIAVLKAWGFEITPGVEIRYGNTSRGTPDD